MYPEDQRRRKALVATGVIIVVLIALIGGRTLLQKSGIVSPVPDDSNTVRIIFVTPTPKTEIEEASVAGEHVESSPSAEPTKKPRASPTPKATPKPTEEPKE